MGVSVLKGQTTHVGGSPRWKELGRVEVGRWQWCEAGMVGGDHVLLRHQDQLKCWIYLQEEVIRGL